MVAFRWNRYSPRRGGDPPGTRSWRHVSRPGAPIRQDFRPLVFWLGSAVTDAGGRATTTVTLPDSLTTLPDHGGRGKRGLAVRIRRARDPRDARPAPARRRAPRPERVVQSQRLSGECLMPTGARGLAIVAILSLAILPGSSQAPALRIVSASPAGELDQLADAGQIRIIFSEPMVALGSVPPRYRAALDSHHAGGDGELLLVGHQDPHLLAGRIGAVAVRHALHGARRWIGGQCSWPHARRSGPAHVHDADRPAALGRVVSTKRTLRRPGRHRAAVQPAGPAGGCRGARARRARAARMDRAGVAAAGT